MTIFYDIIYFLAFVLYIPVLMLKGKWHAGFKMRLGLIPSPVRAAMGRKPNVWFHAVSVGEVLAVIGLVEKVKAAYPQYQMVVSTVTRTGYELAVSRLSRDHLVIFAPLDLNAVVNRYIKLIQPKIYISTETEIWPNLFAALGRRRIPIFLVNGRISEKSFRNYQRMKFLFKRALKAVTLFCMQSAADAQRVQQLGVEPGMIIVTGNMKFDQMPSGSSGELPPGVRYGSGDLVWVAGSTHPGEEKIVLDTFRSLRRDFPSLRLILAPRHVERAAEVSKLIEAEGMSPRRLSEAAGMKSEEILLVDTIGHLRSLYQVATVVFVGKSLTGQGGQNIMEPAFYGKPVIVGPHMQNFKPIMALLKEAGAIVQVSDAAALGAELRRLLREPHSLKRIGEAARQVIIRNQGATDKTFQTIARILPVQ